MLPARSFISRGGLKKKKKKRLIGDIAHTRDRTSSTSARFNGSHSGAYSWANINERAMNCNYEIII